MEARPCGAAGAPYTAPGRRGRAAIDVAQLHGVRPGRYVLTVTIGAARVSQAIRVPAPATASKTSAARKKKKKSKAIKCKKGQAPIKVNRRVVGCRSLA